MTQEQIKAIIQMLVTLVVTLAGIFGYSMAEEQAQQIAIVVAALVVIAYSVWKNANFTKAAGTAQGVTDGLKDGTIDQSAINAFLGAYDEIGIMQDGKEVGEDDRQ